MIIEKTSGINGAWLDKKELQSGDIAKLTTEAKWVDGTNGKQLVAKIRVKGQNEDKNTAINTPSRNALIDAFGDDSNAWVGKHLTIKTESGVFAGKRGIAMYLIPEGYELKEDGGGYLIITKIGGPVEKLDTVEYPTEDINAEDVGF